MAVRPIPPTAVSTSRDLTGSDDELRASFRALSTVRDVAQLLDVPFWQLSYAVHRSAPGTRYKQVQIPKKRGGTRALLVPNASLAILQRKLLRVLTTVYRPKACVHGFVQDRSTVTNAKPHVRRAWILNIDLEDFFATIHFGRVRGMFLANPYRLPESVATLLAQICCHQNQLPQGAPTSPIISNMICARLDGDLIALAKRHRLTYTRFADDLTLSSTMPRFPPEVATPSSPPPGVVIGPELDQVINSNGFRINPKKCRLQGRHSHQEVTGITVSQMPNVRRSYMRRIRSMLHAWEKLGLDNAAAEFERITSKPQYSVDRTERFRNVVRGHIAYVSMVRGRGDGMVAKLWQRYALLDPSYAKLVPRGIDQVVLDSLWVLECEKDFVQGTAFALGSVGLITCAHVLGSKTHAFRSGSPGSRTLARILARSDELDLAVLDWPERTMLALIPDIGYEPQIGDTLHPAGFPGHTPGDSGHFYHQRVVAIRKASGHQRVIVDGPIAGGMSGGPVVAPDGRMIGVVVSGAETVAQANMTDKHGFIPISVVAQFLRSHGLWPQEWDHAGSHRTGGLAITAR